MAEIVSPGSGENDFHVHVRGSSIWGEICAHGRCDGPLSNARYVVARCYPGSAPTIPDPNDPPTVVSGTGGGDPYARAAVISGANWCVHPLPNDQTASSPGEPNTLAVWFLFHSDPNIRLTQLFRGVPWPSLECGAGGSSIACPSILSTPSTEQTFAAKANVHSIAPLTWKFAIDQFPQSMRPFNGSWLLKLGPTLGGQTVWSNGGDGEKSPLIELRCESPVPKTWRLGLRLKGLPSLTYFRSAENWRPLQANELEIERATSTDFAAAPKLVVVAVGRTNS